MKRLIIFLMILLLGMPLNTLACEVCENRQPEILKGVTHGIGPQDNLDYIITWGAVVIVGVTLFFSIKFLVRPKESNPDHIKNIVVE
ncbi:MAG TPA: hypothetical protein VK050_02410 [Flavobacteriaceae bacterium]|nr:hypothetical protein [Flavobacteriaceae bacterium]